MIWKKEGTSPAPDTNFSDAKIKPLILTFTVLPWMTEENPVSDADRAPSQRWNPVEDLAFWA